MARTLSWGNTVSDSVEASREKVGAREGTKISIVFLENSTGLTSKVQEGNFSDKRASLLVPVCCQSKWGLTVREIPFSRRRFPSREPIFLTMWSCPLSRHSRHQTQVRMSTVCICGTNTRDKTPIVCLVSQRIKNGWKGSEMFLFSEDINTTLVRNPK